MNDFFTRLDEVEIEGRLQRMLADRPADLHDYQGCVNDPTMHRLDCPCYMGKPSSDPCTKDCKHCICRERDGTSAGEVSKSSADNIAAWNRREVGR